LLRAASLSGAAAVDAWSRWRAGVDITQLDAGSQRLLPLAYRTLSREAVPASALAELRPVYQRTWARNQALFRATTPVLRALRDAGIPLMLLKGAALTLAHYRDHGVRPMADLDVMVPTTDAERAIGVLEGRGFTPALAMTANRRRTCHGFLFRNPGGHTVDLHWHLLLESLRPDADAEFWACARTGTVADVEVKVLDPAHQLFHACAHGLRRNPVPPLRWVADAMAVITHPVEPIEWSRLVAAAERHGMALPVREALRYLARAVDAPGPADVIARLERMPAGVRDRLEFAFRTRVHPHGTVAGVVGAGFTWWRMTADARLVPRVVGFGRYLQDWFGCDGPWPLARALVTGGGRRVLASLAPARRRT
jgi:hypothetical protein